MTGVGPGGSHNGTGSGTGAGGGRLVIDYEPPGPVAAAWAASRAEVKVIIGPAGSGKTRGGLHDALMCGIEQPPSPVDGLRRYKITVARDTYRRLWDTTIPSWWEIVPQSMGLWAGGTDQPATHTLKIAASGNRWEIVTEFVALGEQGYEATLRGLQTSCWVLEELDTMPAAILSFCQQRAGRYPHRDHGFAWWAGVIGTSNAFDVDSEHYRLLVDERPAGWELYRQPSGLAPQAENLHNLRGGQEYYTRMCKGADAQFIRKFVHAEWGYSRDGEPVYADFSDQEHVAAEPLRPVEDQPLILGADAGLTPAAVLLQQTASGAWLVLDEVVVSGDAVTFGESINRLLAAPHYRELLEDRRRLIAIGDAPGIAGGRRGHAPRDGITGWADPTGWTRAQTDSRSWAEVVQHVTGIRFRPAPSNQPVDRLAAVSKALQRRGGLLISPTCKVLRRGFNSSYRWRMIARGGGQKSRAEVPEKNHPFSDVHDGLQYGILGGGGYADLRGRQQRMVAPRDLEVITR